MSIPKSFLRLRPDNLTDSIYLTASEVQKRNMCNSPFFWINPMSYIQGPYKDSASYGSCMFIDYIEDKKCLFWIRTQVCFNGECTIMVSRNPRVDKFDEIIVERIFRYAYIILGSVTMRHPKSFTIQVPSGFPITPSMKRFKKIV